MNTNKSGMTSLLISITSPSDGARVESNPIIIFGTASAHRETFGSVNLDPPGPLGPIADPSPPIKMPADGPQPDVLIFPSPPSGDSSILDLTDQISEVRVSAHVGPTPQQFHTATLIRNPGGHGLEWRVELPLPQVFKTAGITAEVRLGSLKQSTSIRVSRFQFTNELVTGG